MAHHVVSSILYGLKFELQKGLEFIVCGIQELFEERNQDIVLLVKRLGVLAARLDCYLTFTSSEDATALLHTKFTFLDIIHTSKSSRDLAKRYMIKSAKVFGAASVDDFISSTGHVVRVLRDQREALQKDIRECITVESDLSNYIGEVVKVSRFTLHADSSSS